MNKVIIYSLLCAACAFFSFSTNPAKKKIVFFGDSITEAGAKPGGYISILKEMYDSLGKGGKYELIGAGVSGNKVTDLKRRLDADVLSKKPDVVVIYIGINDVWHFHHDCCKNKGGGTPKVDFEKGLRDIISKIKASGAKVVLCTPSVIGEKTPGDNDLDSQLDQYSDLSRKVAKESYVNLLDLRKSFQEFIKNNKALNNESGILTSDGVHLNDAGNKFLAKQTFPVLNSIKL